MTNVSKMNRTLEELIINHSNDYGFSVFKAAKENPKTLPSLSIVIPYYNEEDVIGFTLKHLYDGIGNAAKKYANWKYEVIIVDDGSKIPTKTVIRKKDYKNLQILRNDKNKGRTYARNKGLKRSKHKLTLFMDADIAIDDSLILNHLKVQSFAESKRKKIITVGLFESTDGKNQGISKNVIKPGDLKLDDFRIHCIYQKTWYGSKADKTFIGREFNILRESRYFKKWPRSGFLGPWLITNMVLGGFFMVKTEDSKKVGGFDKSFIGYGFTETSLPTKLIAALDYFVVPVPLSGGLHMELERGILTRIRKDSLFRKKHFKYFNKYLKLTLKQSLK